MVFLNCALEKMAVNQRKTIFRITAHGTFEVVQEALEAPDQDYFGKEKRSIALHQLGRPYDTGNALAPVKFRKNALKQRF